MYDKDKLNELLNLEKSQKLTSDEQSEKFRLLRDQKNMGLVDEEPSKATKSSLFEKAVKKLKKKK